MVEPIIKNPIKKKELLGFGKQKPQQSMQGPIEIIRASAQKEQPGTDPEMMVRQIGTLVQRKAVQLLQIANTVFLVRTVGPGLAEFHTFTIEPPEALVERYKAGRNSLKQMGYKKAVSYAQSPAFAKIAEQTGLPVKVTQTQRMIQGKPVPVYQFEVDL